MPVRQLRGMQGLVPFDSHRSASAGLVAETHLAEFVS